MGYLFRFSFWFHHTTEEVKYTAQLMHIMVLICHIIYYYYYYS